MAKAVIFWADQSLQERLGIAQETSQEADERFPLRVPRLARDQVLGAVSIQIRQGRRVLLVEPGGETARGEVLEEGPVQELERRLRVVRTTGEQFKHIGDALESFASGILGEKRAETPDENGPKNVKTKSAKPCRCRWRWRNSPDRYLSEQTP